jgi:hypothetical protein
MKGEYGELRIMRYVTEKNVSGLELRYNNRRVALIKYLNTREQRSLALHRLNIIAINHNIAIRNFNDVKHKLGVK